MSSGFACSIGLFRDHLAAEAAAEDWQRAFHGPGWLTSRTGMI
jgi:hypothetical protein